MFGRENDNNKQWIKFAGYVRDCDRISTSENFHALITQLNSVGCQHEKVLNFEHAASNDGEKIKKPEKFNLKDWRTTVRIEG